VSDILWLYCSGMFEMMATVTIALSLQGYVLRVEACTAFVRNSHAIVFCFCIRINPIYIIFYFPFYSVYFLRYPLLILRIYIAYSLAHFEKFHTSLPSLRDQYLVQRLRKFSRKPQKVSFDESGWKRVRILPS
jgi:hypothetical protein